MLKYEGWRIASGLLFIFSLLYEYRHLEYVHLHGIYRVGQAEYITRIRAAASQEYVNAYTTRRGVPSSSVLVA